MKFYKLKNEFLCKMWMIKRASRIIYKKKSSGLEGIKYEKEKKG